MPIPNAKTILKVIVGSTAHGVAVNDGLEDLDLMEIVIEDAANFVGFSPKDVDVFRTKPQGVRSEAGDTDLVTYGLRKYLGLVLKGNPTCLLPLFIRGEHIKESTSVGVQLQELAPLVVSKQAYMPFHGYMQQQHERLLGLRGQKRVTRPELVTAHGFDVKYAAHIIRLGYQGDELLRTGKITLPMPEDQRRVVLDMRLGRYPLSVASEMIDEVKKGLDIALAESVLQDAPRRAEVESWMVEQYLNYWEGR